MQTSELDKIKAEERRMFPIGQLFELVLLLVILIIVSSMKGSERFPSMIGITFCGVAYWGLNILSFCINFFFIKVLIERYNRNDAIKEKLNYKFHPTDFRISPKSTMNLSIFSIIAGTMAGMLGIGGGMVINPLLLELGLKPTVVASTSGFTILFTSSLSLAQTVLHGDISLYQVGWFGSLSLVGSYGISALINFLTRKYKRESLVLFMIAFVVFLALLIIPIYGIYKITIMGADLTFQGFC